MLYSSDVLLTWCAGLWARAQTCHKDRKKTLTAWSYGFEAGSRAAADFTAEGLKESEMNAECKQQHSLSAGALLLASKPPSKLIIFSYGSSDKLRR